MNLHPQVTGLPEAAKTVINVQLSSPIEEQSITKLFDPLNPTEEGSIINFKGVDTSVATIVVKVSDADIALGSSAVHDVKPLSEIDVLGGVTKKVSVLHIAIVPNDENGDYSPAAVDAEEKTNEDAEEETTEQETKDVEIVPDDESGDSSPAVVDAEEEKNEDEEEETKEQETSDEIEITETDDEFQDAKSEEEESKTPEEENVAENNTSDAKAAGGDSEAIEEGNEGDVDTGDAEENADADGANSASENDADDSGNAVESDAKDEEAKSSEDNAPEAVEETFEDNTAETVEETLEVAAESSEETTTTEEAPAESKAEPSVLVPTCVVQMRVEFNSSIKDQKDELYDLLNKASKRKALAVDKLRKSAAALNRSKPAEQAALVKKDGKVVKAGFLNKQPVKKDMFLVRWYNKTLGPNSFARNAFPIAKNYILFFGGVALMHFQGQQLALPPPV